MTRGRQRESLDTLEDFMRRRMDKKGLFKVLREVYNEVKSKRIALVDPSPPRDFLEYLSRPDYAAWLWTTLSLAILTVILVVSAEVSPLLTYLRYVVGSIYVLFLPGYVTIEALYPREEDLSPLERLALSIGLSLAITPLLGLFLNYTPWGIRLGSVLVVQSLYILVILFVAAYRKFNSLKKL